MAVAVKNPPVVSGSSPLDRVAVVSLVGAVYVLVSLGVVFGVLPYLWRTATGLTSVGGDILLGLVMLAVATGLAVLGVRLYGPHRPAGAKAGVFAGLVGFLLVLLLTRWASLWVEYWVYANHWLGDSTSAGLAITAVVGVALLAGLVYLFFRPETEPYLVQFEGQGWLNATSYKGLQGQRVRRGTILGILLIAGSGVYTMMNNGFLNRLPERWALDVPFTGVVPVQDMGDAGPLIREKVAAQDKDQVQIVSHGASNFTDGAVVSAAAYKGALRTAIQGSPVLDAGTKEQLVKDLDSKDVTQILDIPGASSSLVAAVGPTALATLPPPALPTAVLRLNQYTLRKVDDELKQRYVRVANAGLTDLKRGAVVTKEDFDRAGAKISDPDGKPTAAVPFAATGPVGYQSVTLLPALHYTLPLLLIALSIWLAWRVVNFPPFADFLVATEAELNKVSWTTKSRLVQDTIVVLVTTFLLALFLFLMDQTWRVVLSWKQIGVLQINDDQSDKNKSAEQKPW